MAKAKQDSLIEPHYHFFVIASERCRQGKCLPCDTPDDVVDAMTVMLAEKLTPFAIVIDTANLTGQSKPQLRVTVHSAEHFAQKFRVGAS